VSPPHLVRPCPSPGIYSRSNTSPDRIIFKSEFSNITLIISYIHFIYWIISKNGNSPLAGKNRAYGRISGFTAPVEINKKQHPREREPQNRWGHPGRLDLISVYSRPLAPFEPHFAKPQFARERVKSPDESKYWCIVDGC
jgi:hypothetical protein